MSSPSATVDDDASLQCPSVHKLTQRRNELRDELVYRSKSCTPQDRMELEIINALERNQHVGSITAGEIRREICRYSGLRVLSDFPAGADAESHFAEAWNRLELL